VLLARASGASATDLIPGEVRRMRTYRVYFLARGDEVVGSQSFDAADDRAAKIKAEELCRDHPGCVAVEIWDGGWPVYRHLRAASKVGSRQIPSAATPSIAKRKL